MTGVLQPLDLTFRIADERGMPTIYFVQWAQQRQIDIGKGITAEQAAEIVQQFLADHPLLEGSGIGLSPSGNIGDGVTISAEVQAILDQISTTQGSILFRGAADWQALAPGAAGEFLQTAGAGADPVWAAGGGGGGGMTLLGSVVSTGVSGVLSLAGIPATSNNLRVLVTGRTTTAGTASIIGRVTFNGDNGANYEYNRWNRFGTGDSGAANFMELVSAPSAGITAGIADLTIFDVADYANVAFSRTCSGQMSVHDAATRIVMPAVGWWRNTAAAVNRVDVTLASGNWVTGSKMQVYGY